MSLQRWTYDSGTILKYNIRSSEFQIGVCRIPAGESERASIMIGSRRSQLPDILVCSGRTLPLNAESPSTSISLYFPTLLQFFLVIYHHPLYFHTPTAITSASVSTCSRYQRSISSEMCRGLTKVDLYKKSFPTSPNLSRNGQDLPCQSTQFRFRNTIYLRRPHSK